MKQRLNTPLLVTVILLCFYLFSCEEAGNDGDDTVSYVMTFTLDGTDYSFDRGPTGIEVPFRAYDSGTPATTIQAGDSVWTNTPTSPEKAFFIVIDGEVNSTGPYSANTSSTILYLDGNNEMKAFGGSGSLNVVITDHNSNTVKGTFSGTTIDDLDITNGDFTVKNWGDM